MVEERPNLRPRLNKALKRISVLEKALRRALEIHDDVEFVPDMVVDAWAQQARAALYPTATADLNLSSAPKESLGNCVPGGHRGPFMYHPDGGVVCSECLQYVSNS